MGIFKGIKYNLLSDGELISHMKDGKEKAFEELYRRYSKKMLFFFYQKLSRDREEAQDFLQDLFLKIVEKPEAFDVSKRFSVWIYAVANNMCKNEYRRRAIRFVQPDVVKETDARQVFPVSLVEELDLDNFVGCLNRELNLMEEKHSLTFVLKHQQGMTIKEISEIMDCSQGTVKSRLFYSIKKLSKKLQIFHFRK